MYKGTFSTSTWTNNSNSFAVGDFHGEVGEYLWQNGQYDIRVAVDRTIIAAMVIGDWAIIKYYK